MGKHFEGLSPNEYWEKMTWGWWILPFHGYDMKRGDFISYSNSVKACPKCNKVWDADKFITPSTYDFEYTIYYYSQLLSKHFNKEICKKCEGHYCAIFNN